jgi:CO/xanthine dehydrogenase Mo-binding subunit
MALTEDFVRKDGKAGCLNFDTYRIPRMTDLPEMTGIIVENHDPNSLTGAKGIGEPALELIAPAIANAVFNATGVRYKKMPIRVRPEDLA